MDCFASLAMTVISPRFPALGESLLNVHDRPRPSPSDLACARRTIQRLAVRAGESDCRAAEKESKGRGAVRDRLRSVGAAAYRHLRRGRAHHHGAPCLSRADRGQDQDPAAGVLRRHGRPAQGAGQRPQSRHDGGPSRQAADARAGSVLERTPFVRRRQQRAAARVPRSFRLRLRVCLFDRLLHVGPLRRDAAQDARRLRQGDGDHPADAGTGPARDLFAVPPDQPDHRRRAAGADDPPRHCRRHHHLCGPGHRQRGRNPGHGRQCEVSVEGRLGDALGRARRRLRDGRQGSDRTR